MSEQVVVVLGTQWGDEGKGKLVDILARQYDIVARAQVTVLLLPSIILLPGADRAARDVHVIQSKVGNEDNTETRCMVIKGLAQF